MVKKKVAAYIRVSTDSLNQENSYEVQERHFNQLLSGKTGWVSAGIYSDYGLSGTSGEKRTGFKRLLRHCKEGKIDRVVCKSISRFARNTSDFMAAMKILNDCNVTILFEKEALDTAKPSSAFILTTLEAIAQEESRSISENIRWSMEKRFPKGDVRNQKLYGYYYNGETITTESGYQYKAIEIVEEEAAVVRRIFRLVADGVTYKKIARTFNMEGIPSPISFYTQKRKDKAVKGQLYSDIEEGWTAQHISQIVHRERYAGDVLIQKTYTLNYLTHRIKQNKGEVTQYLVKNHHPAIVSRELYAEAQKVVQMNSECYGRVGKKRLSRPFSGRLICAECGRYYHVRNTHSHPIWFCPSTVINNGKSICHSEKIYEAQIVWMFRKAVAERFQLILRVNPNDIRVACMIQDCCGAEGPDDTSDAQISDFIEKILVRMEDIQQMDDMERERSFLKRQVLAFNMTETRIKENIRQLKSQRNLMKTRKYTENFPEAGVLSEHLWPDGEIGSRLEIEKKRLAEVEEEKRRKMERLCYLEKYWEELEESYEIRKKAIEWMARSFSGSLGISEFMNRLTEEYVKAFALSIIVYSPFKYQIHWFDDVRTEVEIDRQSGKTGCFFDR